MASLTKEQIAAAVPGLKLNFITRLLGKQGCPEAFKPFRQPNTLNNKVMISDEALPLFSLVNQWKVAGDSLPRIVAKLRDKRFSRPDNSKAVEGEEQETGDDAADQPKLGGTGESKTNSADKASDAQITIFKDLIAQLQNDKNGLQMALDTSQKELQGANYRVGELQSDLKHSQANLEKSRREGKKKSERLKKQGREVRNQRVMITQIKGFTWWQRIFQVRQLLADFEVGAALGSIDSPEILARLISKPAGEESRLKRGVDLILHILMTLALVMVIGFLIYLAIFPNVH